MGFQNALKVVARRFSSQPTRTDASVPVRSSLLRKRKVEAVNELAGVIANGHYRIEAPIGSGASGIIYSAWEPELQRRVAIKVLRAQYARDIAMTDRLLHEADMAAAVHHEHVIKVLNRGHLETGSAFIVLEYVDGRRLSDLLDQDGALELPVAIDIAIQIADALQATHQSGVFHGDVKPENILLCKQANNPHFVKLIDFGVAGDIEPRPTSQRSGFVCGTPSYMSPEQAYGESLDGRTDLYSLGIVLYEMLSGSPPIRGSHPRELLQRQRSVAPLPLRSHPRCQHIPTRVEAIVHRCLEKDPARRYPSASDLLRELRFVRSRLETAYSTAPSRGTPIEQVARQFARVACQAEASNATATPIPESHARPVRPAVVELPKLPKLAVAVPANDAGRPLASLPIDSAALTSISVDHTVNSLSAVRRRSRGASWAATTRESRRPSQHTAAPGMFGRLVRILLVGLALGYASATAFTHLTRADTGE